VKTNFDNDLDLIERDIAHIERLVQIKVWEKSRFFFLKEFSVFLVKTIRNCINNESIKWNTNKIR